MFYFWSMDLWALPENTGTAEWVLLGLLACSFLIQGWYYLLVYLRLYLHSPSAAKSRKKPVSVVICARNEAANLEKFLPRILTQDYPEYEVVVVNDRSTDQTEEILFRLASNHSHLRFTNLPVSDRNTHGKKLALTIGLKSARYDHVLLTDADCYPASDRWIRQMTAQLGKKTRIVLGYGRYERRKGLLNVLIRYDTAMSAVQYLSFALKGKPYMGVGRNLSYDKQLFFGGSGLSRHYHIASGDDDLFVNEHARAENTATEFRPECHTISVPETRLRDWIRQKQRHLSAGKMYHRASRALLGTEYFSRIALYGSVAAFAVSGSQWIWWVLVLFVVFQAMRLTVLKMAWSRLNEKYLLLPSLLLDPVLPLVLGLVWISNIFVTKYQPWS